MITPLQEHYLERIASNLSNIAGTLILALLIYCTYAAVPLFIQPDEPPAARCTQGQDAGVPDRQLGSATDGGKQ